MATLNPGLNDPADPKDIDTSVVAYLLFNPALHSGNKVDSEVSVKEHLKADTPPMVAFWGTEDNWLKGWNQAYEKIESLGIPVEWWSAVGQGHALFNKEPWKTLTIAEADRFLVRQGLLQGEPTLPPPPSGEELIKYAQGVGTPDYPEDIFTTRGTREIPAMDKYFTHMNLLSLSFRKNLRARRYPLRNIDPDTESVGDTVFPHVDYIGMIPGKTYLVDVKKQGASLTLRLTDKATGEEYANHTWDMTKVGKEGTKTAPILHKDRIGLRHMSTKQFIYKDFKVEQL